MSLSFILMYKIRRKTAIFQSITLRFCFLATVISLAQMNSYKFLKFWVFLTLTSYALEPPSHVGQASTVGHHAQ